MTAVLAVFVSGLANARGVRRLMIVWIGALTTPLRAKVWSVVIVGSALLGPTLFVLLVVQSIAVLGFTAAGLRERGRLAAHAAEHAA